MLNTMSSFIYGFDVNSTNENFNITINSTAYTVALDYGTYTIAEIITEIISKVKTATNETLDISVDHSTRAFTISHTALNFELNISTGNTNNFFSILGFTGSDLTGASTYTSDSTYGIEFRPQVKLQDYSPFNNNQNLLYSTVSKSALGRTQVVNFGSEFFMRANIVLQTNETQASGGPIENQANGYDNLVTFMEYITKKNKIMFKEDRDSSTFTDCLLESSAGNQNGTGFTLVEYLREFPEYYTTGLLTFRKV